MTTTGLSGPLGSPGRDVTPGTLPTWALVFSDDAANGSRLLTISGDTYDGSVTATLPADLSGGRYEVVVEGLTDEDYQRIRRPAGDHLRAELHLWWKDSGSGVLADLTRAAGLTDLLGGAADSPPADSLVAVIRVDTLRRQAGERRIDTIISGRELVFARLGEAVVRGLCYTSLEVAAQDIARVAGVPVVTHGLKDLAPAADEKNFADVRPGAALEAMRTVRSQAAASLGRQGLSAAVVRDGVLHVGLWTATDAGSARLGNERVLDASGGLLAVTRGADADAPVPDAAGKQTAKPRATVTATCLGRPDLKPGDIAKIPLPPDDFPTAVPAGRGLPLLNDVADLFGAGAGSTAGSPCLVTGVTHRLSVRQGFVTIVRAAVLRDDKDDGWDPVPPPRHDDVHAEQDAVRGSVPADKAAGAAGAVRGVARAVARGSRALRLLVGQIRAHPAGPGNSPDQTSSDIWYSQAPDDGRPAAVRRLPVTPDQHGELRQVPVVTPFAFGGYGLVLPRYPGERVLLADTGGGQDVVDLGSVWDEDRTPPAEPGDWWLLLPVAVPTDDLEAGEDAAPPADGFASHDLTDADGRRIVEVSGLTLRVADVLRKTSERPDPGQAGVVILESTKGGKTARIELHDDGTIAITGTGITLDAGTGDITLKAADVKVSVTGTMDVS
ncbi:hypothetical protein AB0E63_24100 [Kribbella sp. NPDC026596]|uniref:hypothetical protein n=1 Tax=Kribbella sp. NPDC026596 TaxID=3155122 RepID=UPI0033E87CA1